MLTPRERETLTTLAKQTAEIAARPEQASLMRMWKALNARRMVRPMVKIEELPWNEMDFDGSLKTTVEDPFWQGIERGMRQTLYKAKYLPADMVVLPKAQIPRAIHSSGFGFETQDHVLAIDQSNHIVSHDYIQQISGAEDIDRIQTPRLLEDISETNRRAETAHSLFEGILDVEMMGISIGWTLWDDLVRWLGPQNMLIYTVEDPDFLNALMARYVDVQHQYLTQAEEKGFLENRHPTAHCTYTFMEDAPLSPPGKVPASEIWVHGAAQLFSHISKQMHNEFEFDHVRSLYGRIGHANYGCCEPLHGRMDLVRSLPNVLKVSISPWADIHQVAEEMGGDFVMSRKPSPAYVAGTHMDFDIVRRELNETISACRKSGTPVEFILKDISTVCYDPKRLFDYSKVALQVVQNA